MSWIVYTYYIVLVVEEGLSSNNMREEGE